MYVLLYFLAAQPFPYIRSLSSMTYVFPVPNTTTPCLPWNIARYWQVVKVWLS